MYLFHASSFHKFFICHWGFYVSKSSTHTHTQSLCHVLFLCASTLSQSFHRKIHFSFNGNFGFSKLKALRPSTTLYAACASKEAKKGLPATVRGNLKLWKFYRNLFDIWIPKSHPKKTKPKRGDGEKNGWDGIAHALHFAYEFGNLSEKSLSFYSLKLGKVCVVLQKFLHNALSRAANT